MKTAAAANARWLSGMNGAQQAYTDGVNAVTTPPGQAAANAAPLWLANTTAAVDRYRTNSAAVPIGDWKTATTTKGAPRLASGAQAAQGKQLSFMTKYLAWAGQTVQSLPARGNFDTNMTRADSFIRAAHAAKGSFK